MHQRVRFRSRRRRVAAVTPTLADLAPGDRATVRSVLPARGPDVARRLGELGFTPGAAVRVVRRAPLRDPVVYRVADYEVCLRRSEAALVLVTRAPRDGDA